ncbi:hypothetical protein [Glycomyces paridis]|uniref:Uncharacterized protein n=1 Tax=Glycomyces paridis TaxID=2126555 RepID=A0A4S8P2X4_9ACTN|nr:hypothetical protein [Glycomyces paridis]THV24410.1 hypothetical protein E9998_21550 [Glycomyces paridis]
MTHNVRVPQWFPLLMSVGALVSSGFVFAKYSATGDGSLLFFALWGLLVAVLAIVFRNMATLKVRPDLVVSRTQNRSVKRMLHPADRLEIVDGRLFVVDYQGAREEIPLNVLLLRESDWLEFEAAVAHRWPPKQ